MLKLIILSIFVLGGAACSKQAAALRQSTGGAQCKVHFNSPADAAHTDLLVYSDKGTRPLLRHFRSESGDIELPVPQEDLVLAAIANLPGELNTAVLGTLDRLEHISMPYSRENPELPVMSGMRLAEAGSERLEMALTPLLCTVSITGIDSRLERRLEEPQLYLKGASSEAGIFRSDGFHPSGLLDSAEGLECPGMMLSNLPVDLGINSLDLGFRLFCYPNDDPFPGTRLCIGGSIDGELKEYSAPLGPLSRAEKLKYRIDLGPSAMTLEPVP